MNKKLSLKNITGRELDYSPEEKQFTSAIEQAWDKPLEQYSAEDLRLMINQELELAHLLPLALDILSDSPLANGGMFHGDLLYSVLNVNPKFWKEHQDMYWQVMEISTSLPDLFTYITKKIGLFDELKKEFYSD